MVTYAGFPSRKKKDACKLIPRSQKSRLLFSDHMKGSGPGFSGQHADQSRSYRGKLEGWAVRRRRAREHLDHDEESALHSSIPTRILREDAQLADVPFRIDSG